MKKLFFVVFCACIAGNTLAYEISQKAKILKLYAYGSYGSGDFVVHMDADPNDNTSRQCLAYWVSKNHSGYESVVSTLLAAYHTRAEIRVEGIIAEKWSGSAALHCRIWMVEYSN